MPATPIYALPYPAAADPADIPVDIQELAERVELVFPSKELAYAQITANASPAATTEATATAIVTAPAVTFDGSPALVEFFSEGFRPHTVAAATITLWLFMDGASLGAIATTSNAGGTSTPLIPVFACRRVVPAAGSHTYSIRASVSTGTGSIVAGSGAGPGTDSPAFIRITRV